MKLSPKANVDLKAQSIRRTNAVWNIVRTNELATMQTDLREIDGIFFTKPNRSPATRPNTARGKTEIKGFTNAKSIELAGRVKAMNKLKHPNARPATKPCFHPNSRATTKTIMCIVEIETTP